MKNILLIISIVTIGNCFSQSLPPGISYSAVAIKKENYSIAGKNVQENYWASKPIKVRFSIFDKYPGGKIEYSEYHNTNTDNYGIFNLVIGQGKVISGDFQQISWELGSAHLQVEIDFLNNDDYTLVGVERFWSVPYAFVTRKQKNSTVDSLLNDLYNKYNYLRIRDKDTVVGNEVSYLAIDSIKKYYNTAITNLRNRDKDTVIGNEIQVLTLKNDTLELSLGGGKVPLTDLSSTNELQKISKNKDTIELNMSGGKIKLNDDDSLNEIQDVYAKGDTLYLTKSKSYVILSKIVKGSSSGVSTLPIPGASLLLGEGMRIDPFCENIKYNTTGIPTSSPALISFGEYKDSIYYLCHWNDNPNLPNNISGEYIIAKSKINCGIKLVYKSSSLKFMIQNYPSGIWNIGFINGVFNIINKNEDFITFDVKSYTFKSIKLNFPTHPQYYGQFSTNIYNYQNKSTRYKDTLYLIYNRMFINSGGSYLRNYRLYKFNAFNGNLFKVDSFTNFQNYNIRSQTFDSVNYSLCDGKNVIAFNFINSKRDTLFSDKGLYTNLAINTYTYFQVFKNNIICIALETQPGFISGILIYDLLTKKVLIQDVKFLPGWSTLFPVDFPKGSNLSQKGTNGNYLTYHWNSLSTHWYTYPFAYVIAPKILYVK